MHYATVTYVLAKRRSAVLDRVLKDVTKKNRSVTEQTLSTRKANAFLIPSESSLVMYDHVLSKALIQQFKKVIYHVMMENLEGGLFLITTKYPIDYLMAWVRQDVSIQTPILVIDLSKAWATDVPKVVAEYEALLEHEVYSNVVNEFKQLEINLAPLPSIKVSSLLYLP